MNKITGIYVTGQTYCIEVLTDDFLSVERYEDKRSWDDRFKNVTDQLEELGAQDVEYNGHFGPSFFFWLSQEDENRLSECVKIIEERIKEANDN